MQHRSVHGLVIGCLFASAISLSLLIIPDHTPLSAQPTVRIVCTTGMIADIVRAIAGQLAHVDVLMGAGIDPHLYRATESNVHMLGAADLIICNGLHLEGKMGEIFSHLEEKKRVLSLGNQLPTTDLISLSVGVGCDPHIWHDVTLWKKLVPIVCRALCTIDEIHAQEYEQRAAVYDQALSQLDTWVCAMVATIAPEHRILVTAHDAFAYFGKRYGIRVVGLQGVSTESEIGMRDVQGLAHLITAHRIPAIFVESSIPERAIKAVQEAVMSQGYAVKVGPELFSDALGDRAYGADTYIGMISYNVRAIVGALSGSEV